MKDGGPGEAGFEKRATRVLHGADTPDRMRIYQKGENREEIADQAEFSRDKPYQDHVAAQTEVGATGSYFLKRSSKAWRASLERGGGGAAEPAVDCA